MPTQQAYGADFRATLLGVALLRYDKAEENQWKNSTKHLLVPQPEAFPIRSAIADCTGLTVDKVARRSGGAISEIQGW